MSSFAEKIKIVVFVSLLWAALIGVVSLGLPAWIASILGAILVVETALSILYIAITWGLKE